MHMNGSNEPATLFGALAAPLEETRSRILLLLERQELNVSELCAVLQLPQPTVSRHLKALAEHGWVQARSEGTSRPYRRSSSLEPAARRLWKLLQAELEGSPAAERDAERMAAVLAERRSRSEAFFASAAGEWDALRDELFGRRSELLGLPALLDPDMVVGDLGCGTGALSAALAPFVARVVAVDRSREMIAAARRRVRGLVGVELRQGALEALPIEDGELDAAALSLVLSSVEDPVAVLAEAARALRPGGRLLVMDMAEHGREEYQARFGHARLGLAPDALAEWLEEAGFRRARTVRLPPDPGARGPQLLACSAERAPAGAAPERAKRAGRRRPND